MSLPSGDTITITYNTSTLRGNKDFQITMTIQDVTGGTDIATSFNMTLSDIGSYEFTPDIVEDSDNVEDFYINIPSFEFSFWSDLNGDKEFGGILDQLTFQNLVEIEVTYNGATDTFLCQKGDFEYDRLNREVTCKCYSPLKYGTLTATTQISAFNLTPYETAVVYLPDGQAGSSYDYDFVTYYDTILAYLDTFGSASAVIKSSYSQRKADVENFENANGFVTNTNGQTTLEGSSNEFYIDSFKTARDRILEGAIGEAALVGNGFGEAFYVRRDDTSDTVNIDASELEELNIQFFSSPVKSIFVGNGEISASETIIPDNPQTVTVTVPNFSILAAFSAISTEIEIGEGGGEIGFQTVYDNALEIYKKVLGVSDSIKFSGTILGASKVKPHQTITLDTAISEFVTADNNQLRFSSLKYNLKEDKIEFEGYSI